MGFIPSPASNLLLPAVDSDHGVLQALLAGDLSVTVPQSWRFFVAAARGEIAKAIELIADSNSSLATYNRFVLAPDEPGYRRHPSRLA